MAKTLFFHYDPYLLLYETMPMTPALYFSIAMLFEDY